jgi:phosphoglycerate dehydrogenase-like enzyme
MAVNGSQPLVVVVSDVFRYQPALTEGLRERGFRVRVRHDLARASAAELAEALADAWAVVAGSERYGRAVLESCRGLRALARPGVGHDAIDLDAATEAGIAVFVTPGMNNESVADFTLALILCSLRGVRQLDAHTRAGRWRPEEPLGRDLYRKTVGVVGLGAIGQAVGRRLAGFECVLLGVDPFAPADIPGVHRVDLDNLLQSSDVITLHLPLTPATRHIIGARELGMMRAGTTLINTSRGGLVDESALFCALRDGRLAAAGLDVYEHEPVPAGSALSGWAQVTLSPHLAGFTAESVMRMGTATIENLVSFRSGELGDHCVNGARLRPLTVPDQAEG